MKKINIKFGIFNKKDKIDNDNVLKKLNQKIIVTFQGADIQLNKSIKYGNRLDIKYDKLLKKSLGNIDLFTAISKNIFKDLKSFNINSNKIIELHGNLISKVLNIKKKTNKKNNKVLKIITVARYANIEKQ